EGLFEVSFVTARASVLPPDLQNWLKQNKKTLQSPEGEMKTEGKEKADAQGDSGKKDLSSPLPGNADGNGQGSAPGKELVFTASLPVKLYHLGTLYDVYDGEKWRTSEQLLNTMPREKKHARGEFFSFAVTGRYTIVKWVSPNLYAPFRPMDFQFGVQTASGEILPRWEPRQTKIVQTAFHAKFASPENLPRPPFSYQVTSALQIPLLPQEEEGAGEKAPHESRLYSSAEDFFTRQAEKEKAREEEALAAAREKEQRKKAASPAPEAGKKAAPPLRPGRPTVLRYDPAVPRRPSVVRAGDGLRKAAVKAKAPEKLSRAKVLARDPMPPGRLSFYGGHRRHDDPAWLERIPKTHFLQLPENLSTRVTGLAGIITKEARTPYEKAVALRDYLRTRYKYRLDAPKTPPGVESTEYFLFESREGHCEYFAAALTVLARASGLPARVAVGFSPGNYNTLTKQFEVHEYHAHAWSQIFIEHVGWLTFDAVPPGNVPSETLPAGLGLLRDPFGEEWRITPPELSATTLGFVRNTLQKEAMRRKSEALQSAISKMLQDDDALKEETPSGKRKTVRKAAANRSSGAAARLKNFFLYLTGEAGLRLLSFLSTARGKAFGLVLLIFLAALFFFFRSIAACGKALYRRHRFGRLLILAEEEKSSSPDKCLLHL
ncbi:MAG: transglutaminase domain-containing protein, partial [Lentisphaeria bacterium]|nr:transglutaminase domain-containing protein [Lentisphaeria bacterium]